MIIASVCIYTSQHSCIYGRLKLVFESVTSQCCVIHFKIQFEIFFQSVAFQKSDNCFCIVIVLVFCRLHRFWFDKESSLETLASCIVARHCKEPCKVFFLTFHIGVKKAHITFSSAPENIIFATKRNRCINRIFHLSSSASHNIEVWIGRSTVHISFVRKNVCCSPKQFYSRFSLFFFGIFYNCL